MCLIAFALDSHPGYRLVLMANRDEYRHRGTVPAGFWPDAPRVLAGRDQQAGGTWLGVTVGGKVAAVTNYRDPRMQVTDPPSRGGLVADYLRDEAMTPAALTARLQREGNRYDGFNLLYGTTTELHYFTNRGGSSGPVPAGIHGLSNHLLDTRWPKLVEAKTRLERILRQSDFRPAELLEAMADPSPFADEQLPDTGIGPEFERFLSPLFINGDRYATRSTTVILVSRTGEVTFCEQNHDTPGTPPACFTFALGSALP
jgi:uncharacterized protein with NRDE domain